jgi:hypothetical protein
MKGILKQILEEMKGKVITNLETIKKNEKIVKSSMLEPDSEEKNNFIQSTLSENSSILTNNMDYLDIQLKIVNLMSKYSNTELMKQPFYSIIKQDANNIDFFKETVEGRFVFNEYHPYFRDEEFIDRLMAYYLENEKFEECQNLTKIKKKIFSL